MAAASGRARTHQLTPTIQIHSMGASREESGGTWQTSACRPRSAGRGARAYRAGRAISRVVGVSRPGSSSGAGRAEGRGAPHHVQQVWQVVQPAGAPSSAARAEDQPPPSGIRSSLARGAHEHGSGPTDRQCDRHPREDGEREKQEQPGGEPVTDRCTARRCPGAGPLMPGPRPRQRGDGEKDDERGQEDGGAGARDGSGRHHHRDRRREVANPHRARTGSTTRPPGRRWSHRRRGRTGRSRPAGPGSRRPHQRGGPGGAGGDRSGRTFRPVPRGTAALGELWLPHGTIPQCLRPMAAGPGRRGKGRRDVPGSRLWWG